MDEGEDIRGCLGAGLLAAAIAVVGWLLWLQLQPRFAGAGCWDYAPRCSSALWVALLSGCLAAFPPACKVAKPRPGDRSSLVVLNVHHADLAFRNNAQCQHGDKIQTTRTNLNPPFCEVN